MNALAAPAIPCCCPGAQRVRADEAAAVARAFKALADPTRVSIVNRLGEQGVEEVCVGELTAEFELSQPTISHHLRVLRDAGIVECRHSGTWSYYRLVPETISSLASVLGG
jgi:ArsR family transcriptional regulator